MLCEVTVSRQQAVSSSPPCRSLSTSTEKPSQNSPNRRTSRSRHNTVVSASNRLRCWACHPASIASNTARSRMQQRRTLHQHQPCRAGQPAVLSRLLRHPHVPFPRSEPTPQRCTRCIHPDRTSSINAAHKACQVERRPARTTGTKAQIDTATTLNPSAQ